jgi:hypothetical protein
MFDSALIDIAIGLSLVFLMFSLLVAAASEMVASVVGLRARHLWKGIATLLQSTEARNALFRHPLIRGLSQSLPIRTSPNDSGSDGPSYIPSKTFALALLETLREPRKVAAELTQKADAFTTKLGTDPKGALTELKAALARASENTKLPPDIAERLASLQKKWFATLGDAERGRLMAKVTAALEGVTDARITGDVQKWAALAQSATGIEARAELQRIAMQIAEGSADFRTRQLLLEAAQTIGGSSPQALGADVHSIAKDYLHAWVEATGGALNQSLSSLLDDAAGNVERFRENIEIWFNDGMDRVSGLYKRRSMVIQFAIALGLAVAMNVDSLLIARALWREPTLRQMLASEGAAVADRPAPAGTPRYDEIKKQIGGLGLPIGWSCNREAMTNPFWCEDGGALGDDTRAQYFWSLMAVFFGWFITAVAASLGAPFWFDMLKRIVSVRSSGKAPEERPLPPKEVPLPREPGQRPIDADILHALSK